MICENCGKTVDYVLKLVIRITGIEPVEANLCRECTENTNVRSSYYHLAMQRFESVEKQEDNHDKQATSR